MASKASDRSLQINAAGTSRPVLVKSLRSLLLRVERFRSLRASTLEDRVWARFAGDQLRTILRHDDLEAR
jgi:hypothetical protein